MTAATPATTSTSLPRRVACWLLALALLLQAVWLPFHLATEHHLPPGSDVGGVTRTSAAAALAREVAASPVGEPESPPHSVLDHQDQQQLRHDENDEGPRPSVAVDDDRGDDDTLPTLWLAAGALQLPIGRAPPTFADADHPPQIRSPRLALAHPRAPPRG